LHVDFAFQPSSAAVGGGSNMVGVTNDLKWVLYDILVLPYTILWMQVLLIKFCLLLRKGLTKVSTKNAASFVKLVLFPVRKGFNKSLHKSCCKFCWSKFCSP
jgi:hypothetical protein